MVRADSLELSIEMGWFWFLAQPMVWVMDKINGYVDNWGLTIVIFTLLIKLVFWPVTAKAFSSMAAMKKLLQSLMKSKRDTKETHKKHKLKP